MFRSKLARFVLGLVLVDYLINRAVIIARLAKLERMYQPGNPLGYIAHTRVTRVTPPSQEQVDRDAARGVSHGYFGRRSAQTTSR